MLWRVRSRARDNDHAPTSALAPHVADGQLAKAECAHEIHIDDGSGGFEQVALLIEGVVKVVLHFRNSGIGDCNVNLAGMLESGAEILPRSLVALDELDALG